MTHAASRIAALDGRQVEQFDGSFALARKFLQRIAFGCVATVVVLIATPHGLFKLAEHQNRMALVPVDLGVTENSVPK